MAIENTFLFDVVTREVGTSTGREFHNRAYYNMGIIGGADPYFFGVRGASIKTMADYLADRYAAFLSNQFMVDRVVVSTPEEDSDQPVPSVRKFPKGLVGTQVLDVANHDKLLPLNMVVYLTFGGDDGRGGAKYIRGMLRYSDIDPNADRFTILPARRAVYTEFAQAIVQHVDSHMVTVRKINGELFASKMTEGTFSKIGFRQLDRKSKAKISTRQRSLMNRARHALQEGQLIGASYNVLQALGKLNDAAAVAEVISHIEPEDLNTGAPQLPGG